MEEENVSECQESGSETSNVLSVGKRSNYSICDDVNVKKSRTGNESPKSSNEAEMKLRIGEVLSTETIERAEDDLKVEFSRLNREGEISDSLEIPVLKASLKLLRTKYDAIASREAELRTKYDLLVARLLAKVECPVCFEVPKEAPINVCPNGHVVCNTCKRERCPTCRVRMGPGTSIIALTVVENIPHTCEFQIHGCLVTCQLQELKLHQAQCQFRTVHCPNSRCPEKIPLATLAEHTLRRCIRSGTFHNSPINNNYHYVVPYTQTEQFHRRNDSSWRPEGICFNGCNFFVKIVRHGKKGKWFFYVQMAGSEKDAGQYTATISVYNPTAGIDGRNSHRFIGEVCPIDVVNIEAAAEAGYCKILPDEQMKKVFSIEGNTQDRKYGFGVRVELSKEEPLSESAEPRSVESEVNIVSDEVEAAVGKEAMDTAQEGFQFSIDRIRLNPRIFRPEVSSSHNIPPLLGRFRTRNSVSSVMERTMERTSPPVRLRFGRNIILDDDEAGPSNLESQAHRGRVRRFERIAVAASDSSTEEDEIPSARLVDLISNHINDQNTNQTDEEFVIDCP